MSAASSDPKPPIRSSTRRTKRPRSPSNSSPSSPPTPAPAPAHSTSRRGRPRLDISETNSRDRRRTQIRLAQRAYRERKEDVIAQLTRRVEGLEGLVREMGETWEGFEGRFMGFGAGGSHGVVEEVRGVGDVMRGLAGRAVPPPEGGDGEGQGQGQTQAEAGRGEGALTQVLSARRAVESPTHMQSGGRQALTWTGQPWGYVTEQTGGPEQGQVYNRATRNRTEADGRPPVSFSRSGTSGSATSSSSKRRNVESSASTADDGVPLQPPAPSDTMPTTTTAYNDPSAIQYPAPPITHNNEGTIPGLPPWGPHQSQSMQPTPFFPFPFPVPTSMAAPAPSIPLDLPLPTSYTHLETSFARRLLRTSLTASQRLLRDPYSNPIEVHRLGKYAMCYMQKHCMIYWFAGVLARPAGANLERWGVPLYHAGGAGLHYPRAGLDTGSAAPPAGWEQLGPVGPFSDRRTEDPVGFGLERESVLGHVGITGDWFDSNDVEQWLLERGIVVDALSGVVEIESDNDGGGAGDDPGVSEGRSGSGSGLGVQGGGETAATLPRTASDTGSHSTSTDYAPTTPVAATAGLGQEALYIDPVLANGPGLGNVTSGIGIGNIVATGAIATEASAFNTATSSTPGHADLLMLMGLGDGSGGESLGNNNGGGVDLGTNYRGEGRFRPAPSGAGGEEGMDPMVDFGPYSGLGHGAKKTRRWMDVEAFMEDLVKQCTCLGRTLCFPKEAVERALQGAIRVAEMLG